MDKRRRVVEGLVTGLKVLEKSTPSNWWQPLATKQAFRRSMVPSEYLLVLKIHLVPRTFLEGEGGTSVQVFVLRRAVILASMACRHSKNLAASV